MLDNQLIISNVPCETIPILIFANFNFDLWIFCEKLNFILIKINATHCCFCRFVIVVMSVNYNQNLSICHTSSISFTEKISSRKCDLIVMGK